MVSLLNIGNKNFNNQMKLLHALNADHFDNDILVGSAEKVLNYKCPGTCLDYAYDKLDTKYVYGWEIYDRS